MDTRFLAIGLLTLMLASACAPSSDQTDTDAESAETVGVAGAAEPAEKALESTDDFQVGVADFGPREEMPGAALYAQHCEQCHNGTVPKAPHLIWLEMMSADTVVASLTDGMMQTQGAELSETQREHIAEYITRQRVGTGSEIYGPQCSDAQIALDTSGAVPPVNWGHDTSRFVPAEAGGLTAASAGELELKWTFGFPGALRARSQPAIAFGTVFVGSHDGTVYALDLKTGCEHWRFKAAAEVRTGVVLARSGDRAMAYFGDIIANQYGVDAASGELVWSRRMSDHPSATLTGTAAFHDGRLLVPVSSLEVVSAADPNYPCCSFRGKVAALDAATGEPVWDSWAVQQEPQEVGETRTGTIILAPSGAPVWNSPTVDAARGRVYFGTGENYSSPADENSDAIIAVDLATGERLWSRQSTAGDAWNVACMMADNPNCPEEDGPDFDHGSSILIAATGDPSQPDVMLAGHKNGTVFAFDPDDPDEPLWATRVGRGSIQGGVHFGMAVGDGRVYAPINDMNSTRNGDDLDPETARPGVHAIDVLSGKVLWSHVQANVCGEQREFCDPGVSAPVTAIPGAVIAPHLDGFVRIYAAENGAILWEFDTARDFDTVNGVDARGGGMSGAGVAVSDGHVVTNSGYGLYFHEPGNLLAVFGPPES